MKKFIDNLINQTINKKVVWEYDPSIPYTDSEYCMYTQYKGKIIIIKKDTKSLLPAYTLVVNSEEIRGYSNKVKELFKYFTKS